jgi:hypothetical protein
MLGAGGAALEHDPGKGVAASGEIMRKKRGTVVKNWWRKWSYEIPLAFSDALWEVCVVRFAAFLDRLTLRKVIEFVAIFILALAFAQTFPIDIAFLFAGDTLMYLEFLVAIRLAAGRLHLQEFLRFALRLAQLALRGLRTAIQQSAVRLAKLRERRIPAQSSRPRRISENSDEEPAFAGAWGTLAIA